MIMKKNILIASIAMLAAVNSAEAQIGNPYIHDPSTIMECEGKFYTFGTGGGGLISPDGYTWDSGAVRPGGGAAPDAIKIGDRYLVAYGATGGGLGGGHAGIIYTMWNKTLDPKSPDFKYSEPNLVAQSEYDEDCDAIDPSLLMGPDGRLWMSYGTYFGFIRLVELDPATGKRVEGNKAIDIAIDCEASALIYRNGWYYLLGTHGTCCDGVNSTYNIVVGRSRNVTGPYIDNVGRDMLKGGGKMVLAAGGRLIGAGHFGRYIVEEGVEKMSCHFEADMDRSGRSVLNVRPLVWKNDWPVAGEMFQEGTYEIESERRGYALELAVDFVRLDTGMRSWRRDPNEPLKPIANQKLEDVIGTWPTGNIDIRIGDYMVRPHQRWTITAVPEAGGYLGGAYYKITIEGTNRALTATADKEVIAVPEFTGAPEQLWQIDQLTDGTYRIMPKEIPGCKEKLALISAGDSTPTLGKFDMNSDNSKWNFRNH
ncbi:MAG: family 43 glycosylhydrolase [Bacteroides sp.]|jgi:arabinan endo-1,5-alpha-L-arabinosidase|nr:family 43 glycosylhydrolase [Bacteroides sp.]